MTMPDTLKQDELVERRVGLITDALLHLNIRGAALEFAARQVDLALRGEFERALTAEAALVKARAAETLLELIREEAGKSNAPFGRSDSLALDRIRLALSDGEEDNGR